MCELKKAMLAARAGIKHSVNYASCRKDGALYTFRVSRPNWGLYRDNFEIRTKAR